MSTTQSPLYAVIDLGSNSFHMLITRQLANSVQVVDKVKRKVRLASGLDTDHVLSEEAIARGLECLSFFAERLQDIPEQNVRIVATATIRIAKNQAAFLQQADKILGQKIHVLSGVEEASYIYQGVAYTSYGESKRLVFDIGGASTEIIVGKETKANKVVSVNIGCVTFNQQYFYDQRLNDDNFNQAILGAKRQIASLASEFNAIGWQKVLGGSGTMQALSEVLMFHRKPSLISHEFLLEIKAQLIHCGHFDAIEISGLSSERKPVIASGVAILIALFETFNVQQLQLSSGALREGLLYEMLPDDQKVDIRQRTINSLMEKFHVDHHHACNVLTQANTLYEGFNPCWQIDDDNALAMLKAACQLHEIGLLLEFKHHQQHSAYIIEQGQLPGFDQSDKQLLSALVKLYKADIDPTLLARQSACKKQTAYYLLAIIRLAVILCRRRKDDVLPVYKSRATTHGITLCLPKDWLAQHPLIADELHQEHAYLNKIGLSLNIQC
ncbi:guanosine-5'-triphosphate,3'-diphosphate pyrophosphatase [Thalassotalea sediminis]|uniref:Ppx/GppA phosphatase family protein n=1 Tax=Thalassotalea sediminis TaxID=1759089 RepID=UPI0025732DE3|nr:guanosine-5'-triphosphate,3'-diphosphate pyrophosphatase [Thalassotalea sediminis]